MRRHGSTSTNQVVELATHDAEQALVTVQGFLVAIPRFVASEVRRLRTLGFPNTRQLLLDRQCILGGASSLSVCFRAGSSPACRPAYRSRSLDVPPQAFEIH